MKQTQLKDLYIEELQDILSAENQLVKALPKIASEVQTQELFSALKAHLTQTQGQVDRLHKIFKLLGEPAEAKECQAMKGLLKEGNEAITDIEKGAVRDAALIGACQRVEHYEMAAYGTARAFALTLGFKDQATILGETLEEEAAVDEMLSSIASKTVNPAAHHVGMATSK